MADMSPLINSLYLKAKTLIDAMQTLNLIPSFSTSNFGGDVLPENILIKNILGEFSKNLGIWNEDSKIKYSIVYALLQFQWFLYLNISFLDSLVASLETLSLLVEIKDKKAFAEDPELIEMKPYLLKMAGALDIVQNAKSEFGPTLDPKEYDADTEGMEDHKHGKK